MLLGLGHIRLRAVGYSADASRYDARGGRNFALYGDARARGEDEGRGGARRRRRARRGEDRAAREGVHRRDGGGGLHPADRSALPRGPRRLVGRAGRRHSGHHLCRCDTPLSRGRAGGAALHAQAARLRGVRAALPRDYSAGRRQLARRSAFQSERIQGLQGHAGHFQPREHADRRRGRGR